MKHIHFANGEYGQCEQCEVERKSNDDLLQMVQFWYLKPNQRRIPYYLYVCTDCYDTRESWCEYLYPDQCEKCHQTIEDNEHYLEKKVNQNNESIESYGLLPEEDCKILCFDCHQQANTAQPH